MKSALHICGLMIDLKDKKIAVLKGGPGSERAVSIKTAESVVEALRSLGAVVYDIDVTGPDRHEPDPRHLR
jgi:D-alanine-D-alanine ligase